MIVSYCLQILFDVISHLCVGLPRDLLHWTLITINKQIFYHCLSDMFKSNSIYWFILVKVNRYTLLNSSNRLTDRVNLFFNNCSEKKLKFLFQIRWSRYKNIYNIICIFDWLIWPEEGMIETKIMNSTWFNRKVKLNVFHHITGNNSD